MGKTRLALGIVSLSEQQARLLGVRDGSIRRRDARRARTEVALELVNVVRTSSTSARVLAVDRVDAQPAGAHAEDERVLETHAQRSARKEATGKKDRPWTARSLRTRCFAAL